MSEVRFKTVVKDMGGWARVYQDGGRFLGLGVEEDGQLAPRRLLHATEEPEMTQKTVEADPPHG